MSVAGISCASGRGAETRRFGASGASDAPAAAFDRDFRGGGDIFLSDGVITATCLQAGTMLLCAKLLSEGQV